MSTDLTLDEIETPIGYPDLARTRANAVRVAGLPPEIVSGGSTPTLWQSHRIPGMTEIRSGPCIFFDRALLPLEGRGRAPWTG